MSEPWVSSGVTSLAPWWTDLVIVSRIVNLSLGRAVTVLAEPLWIDDEPHDLGVAGSLQITGPFTRVAGTDALWRARARLSGRGLRVVRFTRVDVEVAGWSEHSSEVSLRPQARSPHRWGARRRRRYFTVSHLAADAIAERLVRLVEADAERKAANDLELTEDPRPRPDDVSPSARACNAQFALGPMDSHILV